MVQDLVHNLCESLVENIGGVSGVGKNTPPTPIVYLTQWKIVGNSEVHGNEIWSCGEYNATDGKYHILVQPLEGSIADIALDAPLRKVNDVADTIEFPSDTEGKALVTRPLKSVLIGDCSISRSATNTSNTYRWKIGVDAKLSSKNILSTKFAYTSRTYYCEEGVGVDSSGGVLIFDSDYPSDADTFKSANADVEVIYELATPTTELVDAPQIAEADSYSCVISQGGKAVEWSSFETE